MTPPPDLRISPQLDDQPKGSGPTKSRDDNNMLNTIRLDTKSAPPDTRNDDDTSAAGNTMSYQQQGDSLKFGHRPSPRQSRERVDLAESEIKSHSEIAHALESKDVSWFRQTPDRAVGSLALRKNVEILSDVSPISGAVQLPGLSRESTTEPERLSNLDIGSERSRSPSRTSSALGSNSIGQRYSSISSVSTTGLGSPIPLSTSQRLEARKFDLSKSVDEPQQTRSDSRSPERSASPTKGLGGFVQSAMMKRSDSMKRWSAQAAPGLARSDSIASNRSGFMRPAAGEFHQISHDSPSVRETSPLPTSRPGSSHSDATVIHNSKFGGKSEAAEPTDGASVPRDDGRFIKPSLPLSKSTNSLNSEDAKEQEPHPQTPKSPSKEQRRWSPTKASWLESALNRPESQRPKIQISQPPAWITNLEKNRQSKRSVDLGKYNNFQEVTPVGLMRSPPPGSHYKKPSISSFSDIIPSEKAISDVANQLDSSPMDNGSNTETTPFPMEKADKAELSPKDEPKGSAGIRTGGAIPKNPPPVLAPKPSLTSQSKPNSPPPVSQQNSTTDFRSSLRRRDQNTAATGKQEPEFKSVFGKLRKTETAKYVAPDELKNNIVRGKAALNFTGGPKKTQLVDEFKDSILKQKEAMKTGGGSIRKNVENEPKLPRPADTEPEAISIRRNLSRSQTATTGQISNISSIPSSKNYDLTILSPSNKDNRNANDKPDDVQTSSFSTATSELEKDTTVQHIAPTPSPRPSGMEIEKMGADTKSKDSGQQDVIGKKNEPVREVPFKRQIEAPMLASVSKGAADKGSLADRLNPSLANILSRGPPRTGKDVKDPAVSSTRSPESSPLAPSPENLSEPLTHMTKSRARGPKRRLPGRSNDNLPSPEHPERPQEMAKPKNDSNRETPEDLPNKLSTTSVLEQPKSKQTQTLFPKALSASSPKPLVATKSPGSRNIGSSQSASRSPAELPPKPVEEGTLEFLPSKRYVDPNSLSQKPVTGVSKATSISTFPKDKAAASMLAKSPTISRTLTSSSHDIPPSLPTTPTIQKSCPVNPPSTTVKVGFSVLEKRLPQKPSSPKPKPLPSIPSRENSSPPIPSKAIGTTATTAASLKEPSLTSPIPRTSEALRTISSFFNTAPKSSDRVDIDPQMVLESGPASGKVTTVHHQIWEITGDGKKQDLPGNQQYILYEGSMYLCVHVFEKSGDRKTNVHLWCGDEVSEAAIEDTQLFARKVARENGCKLEVLRQGKETATFIQGLGGILITRRGLSSRSSLSALYMLCGRRHLGQIVFDEVDFSQSELRSGYPFVISAKFGTLFLWKGKGSCADEIGAARLLGMDLGLTGEMEEVSEGEETPDFLDIFPSPRSAVPSCAGYWHLKPRHDKYRCRLLLVDHELGQRPSFWNRRGSSSPITRPNDTVQEIEPYSQKDLQPRGIYILDTFFEVYV